MGQTYVLPVEADTVVMKTDEFVECVGIEERPTAGVNSRFSLHDSGESITISFFRVSQRGVVAVLC